MDPKARAFAEDSITAIGTGDVAMARTCIAQACDVDPALAPMADAVYLACSELEGDGKVSIAAWDALGDAVGPGPLQAVVEANRTS
jgi:hypothetical protein